MPVDIAFISAFLNRPYLEGPRQTVGYIPCRKQGGGTANYTGAGDPARYTAMGASGITIATGVDLGQTDAAALADYGLPDGLINQLRPYLGLKRGAALAKLHALPLTVSPETALTLDHAVHGGYLREVVRRWNADSPRIRFADLPKQAQAVVFSLCFQLGCSGARHRAGAVFRALLAGDFATAACLLRERAHWAYPNRREVEGLLLTGVA